MKAFQRMLTCTAGLAVAACSTTYDTNDPSQAHIKAFTGVAAIYSTVLTTYAASFTNSQSQAPLTLVSIIAATDPNLCIDLNKEFTPPNSARLLLQGYVDGDVTKNNIPPTTWSQMRDALSLDANQLDVCYGTFFGYSAEGRIDTALGVDSGTVSLAQSTADPNTIQIDVGYDLVMHVAGSPLSVSDSNVPTPYCVHGG